MPTPEQRDRDAARAALARWLKTTNPGARDVEVSEIGGPTYSGYSHETMMFDAAWTVDGERHERSLVARVKPARYTVFPDDAFEAEHRVMSALEGSDVPLPRMVGLETDASYLGAPFFVMDRVEGQIPPDNPPYTFGGWLLESPPEDQARVWWGGLDAMAAVHRADHQKLGLGFLRASRSGPPGLAAELGYWRVYQEWADGTDAKLVSEALDRLERDASPEPPERLGLCWGDSRIGNQMFRDGACVAVLDWEMATIADPEMDLAWYLYFDRVFSEGLGVARPPGFPTHAETIARWEKLTGRTARRVDDYMVFAGLRFALVMMRLGQMMIHFEQLPADTDFGTNNFAMHFLGRLLEETAATGR